MKRLYRGEEISPLLHPIDATSWIAAGWSETKQEAPKDGIQERQKTSQEISAALRIINGVDVVREVQVIPTIGAQAAGVILGNRPDGGYESLAQVWELCPEILQGRYKTDPDLIAAWGGVE